MKKIGLLCVLFLSLMAKGQSKYGLKDIDGKLICTGFEAIENLSEESIFVNTLLWAIEQCPKFKEGITELNYEKKNFTLKAQLSSPKRSDNPAVYHFLADFAISADKLSFAFSKIECEYPGMLKMTTVTAFEQLKPDKKPKHKAYIDEYTKQATEYIEQILERVKTAESQPVTHWAEIKKGKVAKGMNETECLLAYGKPLDITKSDNDEVRWRYDSYTYLFFKNGVLTSVLE